MEMLPPNHNQQIKRLEVENVDNFDVGASLRQIRNATRRHKPLVFLTAALTLALVILYVYTWPPIYKATTVLMAERDSDFSRDAFYVSWNIFRKDDARTEIELMKAAPVLKEVVERQKLTYDDVYHPFLSEVAYLWQKSPVGRVYRRFKARLFPENYDGLIRPQDLEMGRIINDLREGVSIEPVGDSNVGRMTVKGPSRRVAAIANTLAEVYAKQRTMRHYDEAENSLAILTEESDKAEREVKAIEAKRLAYLQSHGLAFDLQKEGLEVTQLSDLEGTIASARTRIAAEEANLAEINAELAAEPTTRTVTQTTQLNAVRENLRLKRVDLETALISARDRYREDSPEVKELAGDLAKLDQLIAKESEKIDGASTQGLNSLQQELISKRDAALSDLQGLKASLTIMEATASGLRARLAQVPEMQVTLKDLDRELNSAGEKFQALLGKKAQAAVSVTTTKIATPTLSVVEDAVPPADKFWPKTKILYPAAVLVGLILGVFAAMLKSYTERVVRREDLEPGRRFLPLYGTVAVPAAHQPLILAQQMESSLTTSHLLSD